MRRPSRASLSDAVRGPRKWRPRPPVWLGPAAAAAAPAAILAACAPQAVSWSLAAGLGVPAAAAAAWLTGCAVRPLVRDREAARQARERVQQLLDGTRRQAAAIASHRAELRRTNQRLQRSDRYKNEFLANMTHELRSPLNSMLLLSQVLVENRAGRLAADEVDAAQVINKAGRELLVIIDDILDLTKAEAGRLELHPATVEVADLAESLAGLCTGRWRRGAALEFSRHRGARHAADSATPTRRASARSSRTC